MKNVQIGAEVELSDEELDSVAGGIITTWGFADGSVHNVIHDGTSKTFRGFGDITDGTSNTILGGTRVSGGRGRTQSGFLRWFWGSR